MPITLIAFHYRNPSMTHEQFKHHFENVHLPLVKSVCGDTIPQNFKRHYIDSSLPGMNGESLGPDLIAEIEYADEAALKAMQAKWRVPEQGQKLLEDQKIYTDPARPERVTIVGETRQGV